MTQKTLPNGILKGGASIGGSGSMMSGKKSGRVSD